MILRWPLLLEQAAFASVQEGEFDASQETLPHLLPERALQILTGYKAAKTEPNSPEALRESYSIRHLCSVAPTWHGVRPTAQSSDVLELMQSRVDDALRNSDWNPTIVQGEDNGWRAVWRIYDDG